MTYGKEIVFPNGEMYYIQSIPLGDLSKNYPDLAKALSSEDMEEQIYQIVKLQNQDVKKEELQTDLALYKKIVSLFNCEDESEKKRTQSETESDTSTPSSEPNTE